MTPSPHPGAPGYPSTSVLSPELLHLLSAHLLVNLSQGELRELSILVHLGDDGHVEEPVDAYIGHPIAVSVGWLFQKVSKTVN